MYDPTIGRWTSEDPIGFEAADPNLYRYVFNSPTKATDPSGLATSIVVQGGRVFWRVSAGTEHGFGWDIGNGLVSIDDVQGGGIISRASLDAAAARLDICRRGEPPPRSAAWFSLLDQARRLDRAQSEEALSRLPNMQHWPRAFDQNVNGQQAGQMAIDAAWAMVREAAVAGATGFLARGLLPAERQVFQTASAGGRHSGLIRNAVAQGYNRQNVQRAISSLEGRVREHLEKAANPAAHVPNWAGIPQVRQQEIIRGWFQEAINYAEQAAVYRGFLETLP